MVCTQPCEQLIRIVRLDVETRLIPNERRNDIKRLALQPARIGRRVLCQIKEPRIAIEISAAAIDHLTSGERSGRLTFTPARMLSRKSTGTSIAHNSLVIVESNPIDSLNQRSRTGSSRAC